MTLPRWQVAVGAQAALAQVSWVGMRLMTSYRAIELGADTLLLGVVAAAFALPALLGAMAAGKTRGPSRRSPAVLRWNAALQQRAVCSSSAPRAPGPARRGWCRRARQRRRHDRTAQASVALRSFGGSSDSAFGNLTAAASIGQLVGPPLVAFAAAAATDPSHGSRQRGLQRHNRADRIHLRARPSHARCSSCCASLPTPPA